MVDPQGNVNFFKFDFGSKGDAYWILGDSGYHISFHKSGETHIMSDDRKFHEEIDFDLFPNDSTSWVSNYFQNNVVIPEGRDVYAWPIPTEKLNANSVIERFYSIQGRKATVTISDKGIIDTMTSLSPYLYETKDTKIATLVDTYKNCIVLDTDGQLYAASPNGILDITNLSDFSLNTFYKMLGPWGKVLELIGEHMGVNESDSDFDDENGETFFEGWN